MAATGKKVLLKENVAANTNSAPQSLGLKDKALWASLTITNYVAGTYTCSIQHSSDGINWTALTSFVAASANQYQLLSCTNSLGLIRAVANVAGGDADIEMSVMYEN